MFKIKTSCGLLLKSYEIYDIFNCIIKTKGSEYKFYLDYQPLTYNEFLKLFLTETRNGKDYVKLECTLRTQIDLIDYEQKKKIQA